MKEGKPRGTAHHGTHQGLPPAPGRVATRSSLSLEIPSSFSLQQLRGLPVPSGSGHFPGAETEGREQLREADRLSMFPCTGNRTQASEGT